MKKYLFFLSNELLLKLYIFITQDEQKKKDMDDIVAFGKLLLGKIAGNLLKDISLKKRCIFM